MKRKVALTRRDRLWTMSQRHDEHRLTDQPDGFEQQHVFESGYELRQVIAVDEVPDTKAVRGPERE